MNQPDEVEKLLLRAAQVSSVTNERLVLYCMSELDFALRMLSIASLTGNDHVGARARQAAKMTYYKALCLVPTLTLTAEQASAVQAKRDEVRKRLDELGE